MRISNKQQQEMVFLVNWINNDVNSWEKINARQKNLPEPISNYQPSQEEKNEYIQSTVLGNKNFSSGGINGGNRNRLFDAKRSLDICIKMWREGLVEGIIFIDELYEDFPSPYGKKLIDSVLKSLDFSKIKGKPNILTMANAVKKYEMDTK